ncbi:MAG TPA: hypothetical protein VGQ44_16525 [Gemmatimonadaceae bacterium]|jgi:hypothetical protein|nr:hypothetical protein [Gemmatimonadaceae bacterium]
MAETPRGTIAVNAARVGRADLGEATATVDDDVLTVIARPSGAERLLRIPISAIDGLAIEGDEVVVSVRDGRQVALTSGDAAKLHQEIVARCFVLPELTRTLRTFGSRRGQRGRRPNAAADQQKFFAPLVDARRAASKTSSAVETIAAFETATLTRAVDEALRKFANERFAQNGPARRALEAELVDSTEPLQAALRALGERASEAQAHADEIRIWRTWALSLRNVFEAADRVWVALDEALDAAHASASRVASPPAPRARS